MTVKGSGGGCKQSLYFPEESLQEIQREAIRQDRSMSWIMQQAWRIARDEVRKIVAPPTTNKKEPPPP